MKNLKCLAARHNLLFDANNKIKICCNSPTVLGSTDQDVEQVTKSDALRLIQQTLENNVWPADCRRCQEEESVDSNKSYRLDYNNIYPEFADLGSGLKTLHFQHDNTCNLKCIYCGPTFSSKWQSDRKVFNLKKSDIKITDDTVKGLAMVTFAGGEPALIKSYTGLIERISRLNPNCEINVNTNLTHFHDSNFFRLLERHKNTKLIVSYEATGNKFEYIRHYANWSTFESNFKQAVRRFEVVQSSMILFPLSVASIKDAMEFAKVYTTEDDIFINDYYGNHYNWADIGSISLARAKENLLNYTNTLNNRLSAEIRNKLNAAVSQREKTKIQFLDDLDRQHNTNHKQVFPELYE